MGLMKKPSASAFSPEITWPTPVIPDPSKYEVLLAEQLGSAVLLMLRYPECNNYEGRKILLYANTTIEALMAQGELDPHFSNSLRKLSPVARFEPTDLGLKLARECAEVIG